MKIASFLQILQTYSVTSTIEILQSIEILQNYPNLLKYYKIIRTVFTFTCTILWQLSTTIKSINFTVRNQY